jgi:hypothetical protein
MTALGWVFAGLVAWPVIGTAVGVLFGKVVRRRDRQVPR